MGLNSTPASERLHIGFFGLRNAGKSSVVNAVTNSNLSIVSPTSGTTTDPVQKTMELLPLGPIVIIDTPGIDDTGDLGKQRVEKALQMLRTCHCAVLVVDATRGIQPSDRDLIHNFEERHIPYVIALNKCDLLSASERERMQVQMGPSQILVSARTGEGIYELKELIGRCVRQVPQKRRLVADLIDKGDMVVLVIPIDSSAPKNRIILPQQMVLRDILDSDAIAACCQPNELGACLEACIRDPRIVITDSQVFGQVSRVVPPEIALTSFSILMARYKGSLQAYAQGAAKLSVLTDQDRVLISEGCTHHRQCEDIGTVKIPGWIKKFVGAEPTFEFTSGGTFPESLSDYDLVIHCGGCMLNDREMAFRLSACKEAGVPVVNYGIAIAQMHGILERALKPFPKAREAFKYPHTSQEDQ